MKIMPNETLTQGTTSKMYVVYYYEDFTGDSKVIRRAFATKRGAFGFAETQLQLVKGIYIERTAYESLWDEFYKGGE